MRCVSACGICDVYGMSVSVVSVCICIYAIYGIWCMSVYIWRMVCMVYMGVCICM